jgi:hypothetical protein
MNTITPLDREPSPESVCEAVFGTTISDELLEWPPDLFALTEVILARTEAYRFVLSPPTGVQWPPAQTPEWPDAVADSARRWSAWVEDREQAIPELLAQAWDVFREGTGNSLNGIKDAPDWKVCEALLTLHAIADEACAGLGVALDASHGEGRVYRARGRELLARKGSLARVPSDLVRVLPKLRTPPNGTSLRSLSRYASVHGPGVETRWHKVPGRRMGTEAHDKGVNLLLLPWPLRIKQSDFRPVADSVQSLAKEPFGFFEFAPSEPLDLDLVDRLLVAARDEAGAVNVVVLPESAIDQSEIDDLEALLSHHGVIGLITGVRQRSEQPGQFPGNWVHIAVATGEHWVHIRQSKHHRWALDEDQIYQYHLGGALHPHIRWWEAMEVPRRSIQFVEVGEGETFVALVCEDLAQIDEVAAVLRAVGPTNVVTPLLDGPQLASRWAARYASVLADDPGSAVLTLTSFGMASRSRPRGESVSPVVALWKDAARGIREIPLEPGAQGILLSASGDRATRRSSDGRWPVENGSELFDMSVYQVRAASTGSGAATLPSERPMPPVLELDELTILTSWAEAAAEALTFAPARLDVVPADAHSGAPWRALLGIPEPSPKLSQAIDLINQTVQTAAPDGGIPTADKVLATIHADQPGEQSLERLTRRVLQSALEQRQTRQALYDDLRAYSPVSRH